MSLILAWTLLPLVLLLVGAGWGTLVEKAAGLRLDRALTIPIGLAAAIVAASLFTAFPTTARVAVPVVALGAVAGLILAYRTRRLPLDGWALLVALGVLLIYGAPVILSGTATFAGYIRLDDTSTWFNVIDRIFFHARSVSGEMPSTYSLTFTGDIGKTYPLGAFMLLGVGHAFTRLDVAWIFQPYLACCGAALSMGLYALLRPLIASKRILALVVFFAAQPALLYGYSLWGGIKELTSAFLLVLGAALIARMITERPTNARQMLPLAVAASALILTLSVGAAAWIATAMVLLCAAWLLHSKMQAKAAVVQDVGLLGAMTAVFIVPILIILPDFLGHDAFLFSSGQNIATKLGNLIQPLSGWQLAGIWPIGDFRQVAPTLPSAIFIGFTILSASAALIFTLRRRQFSLLAYVGIALVGCLIFYALGTTPWVTGKTLAICSPAILTAALVGGALLWEKRRVFGLTAILILGSGVMWSNALAYQDVLLAPQQRLAELQHIGNLVGGKGPTFVNEYNVYADRHFLRAGAPVEPAEYRQPLLALRNGAILTDSASANLDSFPLSTVLPYRSIVTQRDPTESRPPSIYKLIWQGSFYQLWERPANPSTHILEHVPLGDSNILPYCGSAQNGAALPLCSIAPVAIPSCSTIKSLAKVASQQGANLVAYQRPAPVVIRGDQTLWPGKWLHNEAAHSLTANTPGTAVAHIALASSQRYELWLGGSFARGFQIRIDGRYAGTVKDELGSIGDYAPVTTLYLSAGVHTLEMTYPHPGLTPGSGDNTFTTLSTIALQPLSPDSQILTVSPREAGTLCGRPLNWLEVVAPGA